MFIEGFLKKVNLMKRDVYQKFNEDDSNVKYDLYGMNNNQPIWADNFINKLFSNGFKFKSGKGSKIL